MLHSLARFSFSTAIHTPICVIGGGAAGLNFSSQLSRHPGVLRSQIRIFDPSKIHYYPPAWTMVGGGIYDASQTFKPQSEVFHKEIKFTHNRVTKVLPEENKIVTDDGQTYSYDHLLIASGNVTDFTAIKGLKEALDDPNCPVGSTYWKDYATKFSNYAARIKQGRVVFTEPQMPIKCGGAPQKVLYLNEERFRNNKVRSAVQLEFHKTIGVMFGVQKYSNSLEKIVKEKNIDVYFKSKLVEVRGKEQVAVFENQDTKEKREVPFDLLHAVPPQFPPAFIAQSGLGDATGYCDVDKHTLRHKKYANIWSMGDCANLPTSKTAAAVMAQTPVLVENLYQVWTNQKNSTPFKYGGYTSCPIFVGDNKLILAEFKYDSELDETFSKNQDKPNRFYFMLKRFFFPFAYWQLMSKGIWFGRCGCLPAFSKSFLKH